MSIDATTKTGRRAYTHHHDPFQPRMHAARVFPSRGCRGAFTPRRDAAALFRQIGGVGAADFELEHWVAEFSFAEEEEAGVARGVGLAVVC